MNITLDEVALNVERHEGAGRPLLYLGASSQDLRFDRVGFALEGDVIAFDQRGQGLSTCSDNGEWTTQDYARDAAKLVDALDIEIFDVVGYSFGAMVAQHLAADLGQRIARLALIGAGPGGQHGSFPIHLYRNLPFDDQARMTIAIQDTRVSTPADAKVQAMAKRLEQKAQAADGAATAKLFDARARHDAANRLGKITATTSVIAGRYDGQAPRANVERLAEGITDASFHVLPGGHSFVGDADGPLQLVNHIWSAP